MDQRLTLYDFHGSPCARRVRIVMLEKGLTWETRLIDLTRMEQKRPAYCSPSAHVGHNRAIEEERDFGSS